jgi:hypothetical protein
LIFGQQRDGNRDQEGQKKQKPPSGHFRIIVVSPRTMEFHRKDQLQNGLSQSVFPLVRGLPEIWLGWRVSVMHSDVMSASLQVNPCSLLRKHKVDHEA